MAGVPVTIVGEAFLTGLGVGGGPLPGGPRPEHPIAPGGPPLVPSHPIVIIPPGSIEPGPPPVPSHPIYIPVYPSHPIVIPPDAIAPGVPTHPIYLPPSPSHPIVIPPDAIAPGVPTHPIYLPPLPPLEIWGGPIDPYPDQGPPGPQPPIEGGLRPLVEWKIAWTIRTGWVVVGVPTVPHPTPSGTPVRRP
jgi:hypothetical protein